MKTVVLRDSGDGPELLIVNETNQETHTLEIGQVIKLMRDASQIVTAYAIAGWETSR